MGSMNHVAFSCPAERIEQYRERLHAAGVECSDVINHDDSPMGASWELHEGVFVRSIYFQDPDGILLEFACWTRELTAADVSHEPAGRVGRARQRIPRPDAETACQVPTGPRAEATAPIVTTMYDRPVRRPRSGRGTGYGDRLAGRLVDGVRAGPRRARARGAGLRALPELQRTLDPVLRELAQTRAGWTAASQFVFSQHCKSLRALGVSEEKIAAIPHWPAATCFEELERARARVRRLPRPAIAVASPDGLFTALKSRLGDERLLELTYITALYYSTP